MRVLSNDIFPLHLGLIDMTQPCGPSGISPKIKDILGGRGASEMIWEALHQHVFKGNNDESIKGAFYAYLDIINFHYTHLTENNYVHTLMIINIVKGYQEYNKLFTDCSLENLLFFICAKMILHYLVDINNYFNNNNNNFNNAKNCYNNYDYHWYFRLI